MQLVCALYTESDLVLIFSGRAGERLIVQTREGAYYRVSKKTSYLRVEY